MTLVAAIGLLICQSATDVVQWTFDTEADAQAWRANSFLANAVVKDGIASADAIDWDPFWVCKGIEFDATPWQYMVLRIRADKAGRGQVFWSGETSGQYDGFAPEKTTEFQLQGMSDWEEVVLFPFWQAEGKIRQFRLDVYDGAHFDIDSIRVAEWGGDAPPAKDLYSWSFGGDTSPWRVCDADPKTLFAPRLDLAVEDKGWVTVKLRADADARASILWSSGNLRGMQTQSFDLRGGTETRCYNIETAGLSTWRDPLVAFGIQLPRDVNVSVESIGIAEDPSGPPEVTLQYLGFENGVNRAGRPCRVLAQVANTGGSRSAKLEATLSVGGGLKLVDGGTQTVVNLDYDDQAEFYWTVQADAAGAYTASLAVTGDGAPPACDTALTFLPPLDLPKADYVPEPRPVATDVDVCMYYFPGWESDAKWNCIQQVAPIRKPLLGYYDEANPECVDWQIKWAAENGIKCFLVDWYWSAGSKHLEHWFEAYRKAKYRDSLDVAIMWANHNAEGTHSREDWRNVTREWIDRYFNLPKYYRIDGKPAVFIWAPSNIRRDLGGSAEVKAAFDESQAMAREAGYAGITFLAMFGHESDSGVKALLEEGYYGATNYHEWGNAQGLSSDPNRADYADIAKTVRAAWEEKVARCGELVYYPDVDTGWDSRPWHGDKSLVISGRTPDLFEDILRQAKTYIGEIGRKFVVLGPANEWGEGSYVEPNTEFGFEMYERIRKVYAKGEPSAWPVNVGPADVGIGPYDFPRLPAAHAWTFDKDTEGWNRMMGIGEWSVRDGALRFTTASQDPAIVASTRGLRASEFTKCIVRMQVVGAIPADDHAQLFFTVGARSTSEAASYGFGLAADGEMHTYTIDLTTNPRWRSQISSLRFDPSNTMGVEIVLDEFRIE